MDGPRGLVGGDRGRRGPFAVLVAAASRDPAAAEGLARAYRALAPPGRRRLLEATLSDGRALGAPLGPALLSLLSVEDDAELSARIARELGALSDAGLRPTVAEAGWLATGRGGQGAAVARGLYGPFVELLAVAWDELGGVRGCAVEPMVRATDVVARLGRGHPDLSWREAPVAEVVDRLADALWQHRRAHGPLPEALARFADLFTLRPVG